MKAKQRVKHIVVLMLENRAFDHMLGLLPGVEGVAGGSYFNLADPADASAKKYRTSTDAPYAVPKREVPASGYGGPSHSFPSATQQLFGDREAKGPIPLPDGAPATNNGFVESYISALHRVPVHDPSDRQIQAVMASFTPERLPVLSTLAREFCLCDHWYSEVPGPTEPNRLFMHAATSEGFTHNVWSRPVRSRTIYENLQDAGHDWAFYYYDLADSDQFPALKAQTERNKNFDAFYTDVKRADTLATYSFLCPRYTNTPSARANSQHPPEDVRFGEHLIADVYEALRASEAWEESLFIVLYDEHGGYYDHVNPPAKGVANPDGLTSPTADDKAEAARDPNRNGYLLKPDYAFDFTRLGLRVPAVLISPWIKKGTVDSTPYQHTSVLAFTKKLFDLPNFLTKRDAQAKSFEHLFETLKQPRRDAPTELPRPRLPRRAMSEWSSRGLTQPQHELMGTLMQLDGHPDSGKPLGRMPRTQAAAARYIEERRQAHNRYHRERRCGARFEIHRVRGGQWHWRLRDHDGDVVATSGEGFASREAGEAAVNAFRDLASSAGLVR